jgi:hypothetical protein
MEEGIIFYIHSFIHSFFFFYHYLDVYQDLRSIFVHKKKWGISSPNVYRLYERIFNLLLNMVGNENDYSDSYCYAYMLFVQMYAWSFALNVKGVKCTTTITWLNEKILLRDVCIEEKNGLSNTSNWTNNIAHIKTISKEKDRVKMTSFVWWLNKKERMKH